MLQIDGRGWGNNWLQCTSSRLDVLQKQVIVTNVIVLLQNALCNARFSKYNAGIRTAALKMNAPYEGRPQRKPCFNWASNEAPRIATTGPTRQYTFQ